MDELKASVGSSSLHLRIQYPLDIEAARHTVDQVLKAKSNVSSEGGKHEDFFVQGEEIFSYALFGKR